MLPQIGYFSLHVTYKFISGFPKVRKRSSRHVPTSDSTVSGFRRAAQSGALGNVVGD
jgi:hypothetical protein